jgi:hypothetical protein
MEYAANEIGLDRKFSLSPGQSIMIAGENMVIKFIEVISEGRCPRGAICLWPGEANCLIEITTRSDSVYRKVLTQPGLSGPSKTGFANYKITFDLEPYPEVGNAPDKKSYHLQLLIGKEAKQRG